MVLTRGPVMSPGAIGAREGMPAVEALRPLRSVPVGVLHNAMLQDTTKRSHYLNELRS